MADDEQWVNLPELDKHVKDDVASLERAGPAHLKCKFKNAKLATFRVKIIPLGGGDHEKYEDDERNRNPRFRVNVVGASTNQGKSEVELDKSIFFNAAGGNEYKLMGKYRKTEVESGLKLKSRRKLYYQVMKMTGISPCETGTLEGAFWKPDKKYYIQLKKMGGVGAVAEKPVIVSGDEDSNLDFIKKAAVGYEQALRDLKPYSFGLCFVNYIAKPAVVDLDDTLDLDIPSKIRTWNWEGAEMTVTSNFWLWCDLDPDDDAAKKWLVSGELYFIPEGKGIADKETIQLDRDDFEIADAKRRTYGGRAQIKIKLKGSGVDRNVFTGRKGTWHAKLKVTIVDGWTNGFAYNSVNLIAIADKVVWEDQPDKTKLYTINHEVGHKVGMVADGTGFLPKSHGNLYGENRGVNDQDHQGPHCELGANWDGTKPRGSRWSGAPGCVMFGANAIGNDHAPAEFCADCEKIVRKLDLSDTTLLTTGMQWSMEEV